jgi:hypothetical protein
MLITPNDEELDNRRRIACDFGSYSGPFKVRQEGRRRIWEAVNAFRGLKGAFMIVERPRQFPKQGMALP